MTDEQHAQLGARLQALRAELLALSQATKESAQPVSLDEPIGRLSRVDALQQQQMAEAQRKRAEARLELIDLAIERLREGTYGDCLRCGEEIGFSRLMVKPEATLCVACQQERER